MAVPDQTYLGATTFFAISFLQYTNIKHGIALVLISFIAVIIKSTLASATPSQTVVAIMAFSFIYANIYNIVREYKSKIKDLQRQLKEKYKPKPAIRNIDVINITEEEKAIIKLHCYGNTYEEISKILGLNIVPNTVRRKITAIMKDNNIKNDAHFGHWAFQRV
jgi:DNA-binding NarL/FixJ family response regulator